MGADPLSVLADYEREFASLLTAAKRSIDAASTPSAPVRDAAVALDAADRDSAEAGDVLQSMSLEAASLSPAARTRATAALDAARAEAAAARAALRAARIALAKRRGEDERHALFAGGRDGGDLEAGVDETMRKLEEGRERILDSRRSIAQTEGVAENILSDLASQRATIMRARGNLSGVDEGLEQSNAVLSSMNRRAFLNKMVIYAIYAFIAMVVLWIIYSRLFRG
jgi:vesicle transport through interaction with t-SNAREs 1